MQVRRYISGYAGVAQLLNDSKNGCVGDFMSEGLIHCRHLVM